MDSRDDADNRSDEGHHPGGQNNNDELQGGGGGDRLLEKSNNNSPDVEETESSENSKIKYQIIHVYGKGEKKITPHFFPQEQTS